MLSNRGCAYEEECINKETNLAYNGEQILVSTVYWSDMLDSITAFSLHLNLNACDLTFIQHTHTAHTTLHCNALHLLHCSSLHSQTVWCQAAWRYGLTAALLTMQAPTNTSSLATLPPLASCTRPSSLSWPWGLLFTLHCHSAAFLYHFLLQLRFR